MKRRIINYSFDASEKKITFSDYAAISLPAVLLVTNVTKNVVIYNFADLAKGGSVATNVLTLTYDTSAGMSDTDDLQIFYDDGGVENNAVLSQASLTRPADTSGYAVGDSINTSTSSPTAIEFPNCGKANGLGGIINEIIIETNAVEFASKTLRLYLFKDSPSMLTNDNAAFLLDWDDRVKRLGYVDVTFDARESTSDTVLGKASPIQQFVCGSSSRSIYGLLQAESAITTPTSAGVFHITLNIIQS